MESSRDRRVSSCALTANDLGRGLKTEKVGPQSRPLRQNHFFPLIYDPTAVLPPRGDKLPLIAMPFANALGLSPANSP